MGQGTSSSSILSKGSVVSNLSNSVTKFIKTSALSEELVFQPHTSAHQAFRSYLNPHRYSSDAIKRKSVLMRRKKRSSSRESGHSLAAGDATAGSDLSMTIVLHLSAQEIVALKESWHHVEAHLVQLGVRLFIVVLDKQPDIRRTYRHFQNKRHSELKIQEDLQKDILQLICCLKRVMRYLSDPKTLSKYIRRWAKKRSPWQVNFLHINPAEMGSVFCAAVRQVLPKERAHDWSSEVESLWTALFAALLTFMHHITCQSLAKSPDIDGGQYGEDMADAAAASGDSDSTSSSLRTTFDRHLVLVGCQSFQELFDRHPEVLLHFDKYKAIEIDGVRVSEALRMHASRVLAVVEDIVENTGNPDKIRTLMQDLGRHHFTKGISLEHLDMLGPLICHTIRPLVFQAGVWSIEVEKSWTHLFDMVATLMKRGYPAHHTQRLTGFFPTLTHTLILKDTWALLLDHMNHMGLEAFTKLFSFSANLRYYYSKNKRPQDPVVQQQMNGHFEQLMLVLDGVIGSLPDLSPHVDHLRQLGCIHGQAKVQQRLLQLMGPVFCNSVRPLLLLQGRWSYHVETAWLLLFRHIAGFMRSGYHSAVMEDRCRSSDS